MKVIIAGTRTLSPTQQDIEKAVKDSGFAITEVVCGLARGVDRAGRSWAMSKSIPVKEFRANWSSEGEAAGPIRNAQMGRYADALILIWDGESPGSASMKRIMASQKKPIHEVVDETSKTPENT